MLLDTLLESLFLADSCTRGQSCDTLLPTMQAQANLVTSQDLERQLMSVVEKENLVRIHIIIWMRTCLLS